MPGSSPLPTSPAGSNFIPRREFQKSAPVPATYSLLAFSSANVIRMSHFPESVVGLMRSILEAREVLRQVNDRTKNTVRFVLSGKPWATPKSLSTETLIVEVLSVVLAQGYHFLSLIDYAKEAGDILSIVFSRPELSQETTSPNMSVPNFATKTHVPFALSFVSDTVIRVVSPPLSSTPSILQSVRKAWPRGVVSERKVGNNGYEFKLKGYGIFGEDTFVEDSLTNVMMLLSALSENGFNLLTSCSFAPGRSNSKDMWIMVGMADALPSPYENRSMPNMLSPFSSTAHFRKGSLDGRPREAEGLQAGTFEFVRGHKRNATTPGALGSPDSNSSISDISSIAVTPPVHSATDPTTRLVPRSPLAKPASIETELTPDEKLIAFSPDREHLKGHVDSSDSISWDEGDSDGDAPSLLPPQSRHDSSESHPSDRSASPKLVTPPATAETAQLVATPESGTKSQYITIEEAPDIRATQILYASPPPPPLSPTQSYDAVKIPGAFPRA
ncbi:hypothetical protein EXIGLDRAFT_759702 [Exidia glandulosa HHB12029]|uniref:Uncharacterized protein n=1 Tax=Exidia glandulosa HHB12029 TaxID=1314781 RepID=A0A165PRM7_EXIGL|nr:hypothetical protein EXIGLDRAFT_759702 [Exidia glandulosa HHB12029]